MTPLAAPAVRIVGVLLYLVSYPGDFLVSQKEN